MWTVTEILKYFIYFCFILGEEAGTEEYNYGEHSILRWLILPPCLYSQTPFPWAASISSKHETDSKKHHLPGYKEQKNNQSGSVKQHGNEIFTGRGTRRTLSTPLVSWDTGSNSKQLRPWDCRAAAPQDRTSVVPPDTRTKAVPLISVTLILA